MPIIASLAAAAIGAFRKLGSLLASRPGDTYFKYLTLLLKGNTGTTLDVYPSISPSFIGDASNNIQSTINGVVKSDKFHPYLGDGFYSLQMNGTVDYLSVPGTNAGFNFGTNNFTMEGWFWTTTATQITLFEKRSGASYDWIVYLNTTVGYLNLYITGVVSNVNATVLYPFGQWVHVALVRNGSVFTLYQNGVSVYTTTNAAAVGYNSAYPVLIGADASGPRFWWPGYISNVRMVNGTAVYTAAFTPPTTPLTAIPNTVLLTCNNKNFVDQSSLASVVTVTGTPKISGASPFTTNTVSTLIGSGYFNGTSSDYITGTADLNFGSNDLTVEAWLYPTNLATASQVYFSAGSGNLALMLINGNGGVQPGQYGTSGIINSTGTLRQSAWNHVVVTRKGTAWRVFIDGVLQGYNANYVFSPNNSSYMIGYGTVGSNAFAGYIADLRVVNGSAIYDTAATTIPTAVFTPPAATLTSVASTKLLTLQYNGSPVNTTFLDNSTTLAQVNRAGNATQGTFSPYGGNWSTYFNGTSDYLKLTPTTDLTLTGDFTIECYVYFVTLDTAERIPVNCWNAGSGWLISTQSSAWNFKCSGGTTVTSTGSVPAAGQWYHVAVTRSSNAITIYVNGLPVGTGTSSATLTPSTGATGLVVGAGADGAGQWINGYVSNVRINKGSVEYSADFTPSTSTLRATSNTVALLATDGLFIDRSRNNYAVSYGGAPRISRFGPLSTSTVTTNPGYFSTFFNGSSWLTTPATALTNIGTQDFTIELWYYMTQSATYGTIFNLGAYNTGIMIRISSQVYDMYIVNSNVVFTGSAPLNTWVHLAFVRKTGSVYLWANGVQVGTTVSNSTSISPTAAIQIGSSAHTTGELFFGYVSNLRMIIGTGLYTAPFTPSTTPLTSIAGTTYLTLLNNTQTDISTNNFAVVTSGGTPEIRNFSPFAKSGYTYTTGAAMSPAYISGSAYFDGTGDYLTIPTNPLFSSFYSSANFTVECWFYLNNVTATQQLILSHRNSSTGAAAYVPFLIWSAAATLTLYMSSNNSSWNIVNAANIGTVSPNCWNHLALCRTNGTIRAFLNGRQTYTLANATTFTSVQPLQVGMSTSETNTALNGYISDVRIINGDSLYSSGFLPPVSPLTITKNTSLLLNFNNIGMYDSTGNNDVEQVGTALISTATTKYGSSSIYFKTKTDYLSIRSTPDIATLGSNFTIDCWVYPTDTGINNTWGIIDARAAGATASPWLAGLGSYSSGWLMTFFNGTTYNGTIRIQANTWTHCAWERVGTTLTFYVNGVAGGTATVSGAITGGTTTVYIGSKDNGLAGYGTVGYIDNLRMTNGYARFAGAFATPPDALENSPAGADAALLTYNYVAGDGLSAATAGLSAQAIKTQTGTNTNGVYWINLPTAGPTKVYCIMDSTVSGGGWMMAMKATTGTTFNYSSTHWNSVTVLNTGDVTRGNADAKYNTMNYFAANDIMAVFPDITTNGGSLGTNSLGCWTWLETNYNGGTRITPINFFNTAGTFNTGDVNTSGNYGGKFIKDAKTFSGWQSGIFSSQVDIRFYGFNYKNVPGYGNFACRWGFGWNENGEGLYSTPAGLAISYGGSDDVGGGIGMDSNFGNYSAGDMISCCNDTTGINRSARVEIYIR